MKIEHLFNSGSALQEMTKKEKNIFLKGQNAIQREVGVERLDIALGLFQVKRQ